MATELDTRFWFGDSSIKNNLLSLVTTIDELSFSSKKWMNFTIYKSSPGVVLSRVEGEISLAEMSNELKPYSGQSELKFSVYTSLKCWRFKGLVAEEASIIIVISCWGENYGKTFSFDRKFEGDAQLSILSIGPYCALLEGNDETININNKVEENLEGYLQLLQAIINKSNPQKIIVFNDLGDYILTNSHLV